MDGLSSPILAASNGRPQWRAVRSPACGCCAGCARPRRDRAPRAAVGCTSEPAAVALADAVPATDRVGADAGAVRPCPARLPCSRRRRQRHPIALLLEPGVEVVDRPRLISEARGPTWQASCGGSEASSRYIVKSLVPGRCFSCQGSSFVPEPVAMVFSQRLVRIMGRMDDPVELLVGIHVTPPSVCEPVPRAFSGSKTDSSEGSRPTGLDDCRSEARPHRATCRTRSRPLRRGEQDAVHEHRLTVRQIQSFRNAHARATYCELVCEDDLVPSAPSGADGCGVPDAPAEWPAWGSPADAAGEPAAVWSACDSALEVVRCCRPLR